MHRHVRAWHRAPFLRYLPPFISGILLQWHVPAPAIFWISLLALCTLSFASFAFLPLIVRFRFRLLPGIITQSALCCLAALLTIQHDVRNQENWIGTKDSRSVVARIDEPPVEKPNSFKVEGSVLQSWHHGQWQSASGGVIIYFKKDSSINIPPYGSLLVINTPLQKIKNSGNPGGFDYVRYSLFQGNTHQVFLRAGTYRLLDHTNENAFKKFLFDSRKKIIEILRTNISGEQEIAFAEAILIGYKDDLDKNLVQSYSNTGVVHIIAISGLHLGLIYSLLLFLTIPLKKMKLTWIRFLVIVAGLWLFSLLAGAQPSVLRAAVMFSAITLGTVVLKKSSPWNTLAFSALVLLIINPFLLWDVGFQLSYAAVAGILAFYRPIQQGIMMDNRVLRFLSGIVSVTLAAQVFTLPISIFHFHQMPLLFILSNVVAVPLGSLVLMGEVMLCVLAWWQPAASTLGNWLTTLISILNHFVLRIDRISFAVWNGLQISALQYWLLTIGLGAGAMWLMDRKRWLLSLSLVSVLAFMGLRSWSFMTANRQKKIIVYNVPRHRAIDLVAGRQYAFIGDNELIRDGALRNFHLQPARIKLRVRPLLPVALNTQEFVFGGKKFLLVDTTTLLNELPGKEYDVVIISGNPKFKPEWLLRRVSMRQLVLDGSVPYWKTAGWQQAFQPAGIPVYNAAEEGAFVLNLHEP